MTMAQNLPLNDAALWIFARSYTTLAVNYRLRETGGTDAGLQRSINQALYEASHIAQAFQHACGAAQTEPQAGTVVNIDPELNRTAPRMGIRIPNPTAESQPSNGEQVST